MEELSISWYFQSNYINQAKINLSFEYLWIEKFDVDYFENKNNFFHGLSLVSINLLNQCVILNPQPIDTYLKYVHLNSSILSKMVLCNF